MKTFIYVFLGVFIGVHLGVFLAPESVPALKKLQSLFSIGSTGTDATTNGKISEIAAKKEVKKTKPKNEKFKITNYQDMLRSINPFSILGAYPEVDEKYQDFKFARINYNILNEDDYCERVDFYNLNNPQNIFENKNFWTDFGEKEVPRKKIMDVIGKVVEDNLVYENATKKEYYYTMSEEINSFFMQYSKFHEYHEIGRNFLCATQMYNHIPGQDVITTKDQIVDKINTYIKKYEDRPQCFSKNTLFPYTYRLYVKDECQAFFKKINSQEYRDSLNENAIQYVIKIGHGSHKSQGVFLMDQEETDRVNGLYKNGSTCGRDNSSLLAQTYISNPLLLDLHNKFDFRVYMLVASTNPLIVYYHDGAVKASLQTYNKASSEKSTHLTNVYLSNIKIKEIQQANATLNGMTPQELKEYILWDFDRLGKYLYDSGKTKDPNWVENYLRPAFKKAFIHIVRMSKGHLWQQSNVYSLQGSDFMLDEDMNLWFIENNPSPLFTGTSKWKLFYEVVLDHFEIQYAYMKSRMKRAFNVIKRMQLEVVEGGNVDYEFYRKEYKKAIKNKLEPEFSISKNNSWQLVMDDNLKGAKAYFGLISEECL